MGKGIMGMGWFDPLNTPITDWQGRRVWIVGASSGIGAALAVELDARGARLALSARSAKGLQQVASVQDGTGPNQINRRDLTREVAINANVYNRSAGEVSADIRTLLVTSLADRGFAASSAATGMTGLNQALERSPDIVLLDLGLPDVDGLRVLSMLRAVSSVPVIIVTAQDDDRRVVQGLEAGADDYVVKPFTVDQLAARINAVLRRGAAAATTNPVLVVGELRIHVAERTVEFAGEPLELSRLEFDLLAYLAEHTGEVVSKRELLTEVWKQAYGGGEHSVDVHVSWLRRKLGETAAAPVYIHSIRHVGVRLAAPEITPAER